MQGKGFEILAEPVFLRVYCPKHGGKMVEMNDGWFSKAWWCETCEAPYQLKLVKIRKWDKEGVDKQLKKKHL